MLIFSSSRVLLDTIFLIVQIVQNYPVKKTLISQNLNWGDAFIPSMQKIGIASNNLCWIGLDFLGKNISKFLCNFSLFCFVDFYHYN